MSRNRFKAIGLVVLVLIVHTTILTKTNTSWGLILCFFGGYYGSKLWKKNVKPNN